MIFFKSKLKKTELNNLKQKIYDMEEKYKQEISFFEKDKDNL